MTIYLAQLKCPKGHCVIAGVGEHETPDAAEALRPQVTEMFEDLVERGTLKSECGLCHSTDLHIDILATGFNSISEAAPFLLEAQRRQLEAARFMRDSRN